MAVDDNQVLETDTPTGGPDSSEVVAALKVALDRPRLSHAGCIEAFQQISKTWVFLRARLHRIEDAFPPTKQADFGELARAVEDWIESAEWPMSCPDERLASGQWHSRLDELRKYYGRFSRTLKSLAEAHHRAFANAIKRKAAADVDPAMEQVVDAVLHELHGLHARMQDIQDSAPTYEERAESDDIVFVGSEALRFVAESVKPGHLEVLRIIHAEGPLTAKKLEAAFKKRGIIGKAGEFATYLTKQRMLKSGGSRKRNSPGYSITPLGIEVVAYLASQSQAEQDGGRTD